MKKMGLLFLFVLSLAFVSVHEICAQTVQEDCVGFKPDKIKVKLIRGRWKIIEDSFWIMDFGNQEDEAKKAFQIIKKYGFDHICFVGRPNPSMTYFTIRKEVTTVIIVRHAEKETCPPQYDQTCPLTADGEKRAETLAGMLNNSGVSVVFSTNTTRTKETVNNYADPRGIEIKIYNSPLEVANLIKSNHIGKVVLVVGHSPTVPEIIKALGIRSPPQIGDDFDNFFVVTIRPDGALSLTHLKYPIDNALY